MKKLITAIWLTLALSGLCFAKDKDNDARQELTQMLHTFLDGAAKGDKAVFERFFAEDVIYTRGVGIVLDRATILKDVAPPKPDDPIETYDAEDIIFHQSGDVAVLNFRLVMHSDDKGKKEIAYYRNTGTFQRRSGKWQVVAWQATPIAEKKDEAAK